MRIMEFIIKKEDRGRKKKKSTASEDAEILWAEKRKCTATTQQHKNKLKHNKV